MRQLMARRAQLPASLHTLLQSRAGDRVLVDCVLRRAGHLDCGHCLPPAIVVHVRENGPAGVVVTMPDGMDRRLRPSCAGFVQIEPVNGWGAQRDGQGV